MRREGNNRQTTQIEMEKDMVGVDTPSEGYTTREDERSKRERRAKSARQNQKTETKGREASQQQARRQGRTTVEHQSQPKK